MLNSTVRAMTITYNWLHGILHSINTINGVLFVLITSILDQHSTKDFTVPYCSSDFWGEKQHVSICNERDSTMMA